MPKYTSKEYSNVAVGLKREEIRQIPESTEMPKFRFLKMTNPIEMQFEARMTAQPAI